MTEEHLVRLVEAYSPMLLRLACTRLDNTADAEDAVQEVFLRLLTTRPRLRDAEHEKTWLIRTTLHRAADFRRSAAHRNVPLEEASARAAAEEGGEVLTAVRSLPEKYSAVLHLHYYEGYACQRRYEIVRKRRRNFVVFRRGGGNKNQVLPCSKRVFTICCFWRINSLRSFRR